MPLQDHAIAHLMAKSLARAVGIGEGLVPVGGRRNRDTDAPLRADEEAGLEALHMVGDELETAVTEIMIIRAADSRPTRFRES